MRWRKATWAIIIWTALCAYWLYDGVLNTQAESAERYGLFYFLIVGFSILFTWFVGLLVLRILGDEPLQERWETIPDLWATVMFDGLNPRGEA